MTELRTRMLRDMTVRGLAPRTHKAYIAAVARLAMHYRRSPDQITDDEVQKHQTYLAHLVQRPQARLEHVQPGIWSSTQASSCSKVPLRPLVSRRAGAHLHHRGHAPSPAAALLAVTALSKGCPTTRIWSPRSRVTPGPPYVT